MVIPKINSAHGSDTRNIINRAIDLINVQGKSIQDLVAEGQLTPAQYANLIQTVNGLISKGSISVDDIDTNLGKLQLKHLSEEVKAAMTGETPMLSEVAEGAVTRSKIAPKAVSPKETDFFKETVNLASGDYLNWSIHTENGKWFLQSERNEYNGMLKMIEISPSKKYTIKIFEPHLSNRFRVATSDVAPDFGSGYAFESIKVLKTDDVGSEFTFTSGSNARYLYVYVSNDWQKPKIQVENSSEITDYIEPYVIPKNLFFSEIENDFIKFDNTVTVFEDRLKGYPKRPNATSVIWIGVNEPQAPESFDEWRETNGYTYFTDFSEHDSISDMTDWSTPLAAEHKNNLIVEGDDNKALEVSPVSTGRFLFSPNAPSQDELNLDVEVYTRMKVNSIGAGQTASIVLRGSGSGQSLQGYSIGLFSQTAGGEARLTINNHMGGSPVVLNDSKLDLNVTEYFNLIARVEGNKIKVKYWQDGIEPKKWNIELNDDSHLGSGYIGIYHFIRLTKTIVDKLGVGTGGMKAPKRRLHL